MAKLKSQRNKKVKLVEKPKVIEDLKPKPVEKNKQKREAGWEQKIDSLLKSNRTKKLEWGKHDFMTLIASVSREIGISGDLIARWRGKYKSKAKAQEMIKAEGGITDFALKVFEDFPQIHLHSAKKGDAVLVEKDGQRTVGICDGLEAVFIGQNGLDRIPIMTNGKIVWAIGHK